MPWLQRLKSYLSPDSGFKNHLRPVVWFLNPVQPALSDHTSHQVTTLYFVGWLFTYFETFINFSLLITSSNFAVFCLHY